MADVRPMKFAKLQKAIDSGLFSEGLTNVVTPPTLSAIEAKAKSLPIPMHADHVSLLLEWGGSNLDEIRINPLERVECDGKFVDFANDYNGFVYKYDRNGFVYSEDTDGGELEKLAENISEFINEVFLGPRCEQSYGADWLEDLRKHGLV